MGYSTAIVSLLSLTSVLAVGGCSRTVVRSTGHNILETNAGNVYGDAFQKVVTRMQRPELFDADPENNRAGDGRETEFEAKNRHWGDERGTYAERGSSTFTDAAGVTYTVESTSIRGRLTLYVFEAPDIAKARMLRDAVAQETRAMLKERH
jgi:hypothetical protein